MFRVAYTFTLKILEVQVPTTAEFDLDSYSNKRIFPQPVLLAKGNHHPWLDHIGQMILTSKETWKQRGKATTPGFNFSFVSYPCWSTHKQHGGQRSKQTPPLHLHFQAKFLHQADDCWLQRTAAQSGHQCGGQDLGANNAIDLLDEAYTVAYCSCASRTAYEYPTVSSFLWMSVGLVRTHVRTPTLKNLF